MTQIFDIVPAAQIALGDTVIHSSYGAGVLMGFDADLHQMTVQHPGQDEPTVYALQAEGILRLRDGRWVEAAPKSDFTHHWAGDAHPTYEVNNHLHDQARGVWPLFELAGEHSQRVIYKLIADMPKQPLAVGGRAPLGCWYNPQWPFNRAERYLLTDHHSGIDLTVALRATLVADASRQNSLSVLGMQPLRHIGCQMTCELQKIALQPDGSEGVAQLRWGDGHEFYAHLCCLDEHAPYVHAGGHYDWLLSGVALHIALADTQGFQLHKPDWLDAVNAMLSEPMQLDEAGNLHVSTQELRYLMPSQAFSPQHAFRGQVTNAEPCSFEPLVQGVYGNSGYVLDVAVLKDADTGPIMRVRVVCPAKTLAPGFTPEVGQVVTGQLWLQAWLAMAQLPAPVPKPKPKPKKKPVKKAAKKKL